MASSSSSREIVPDEKKPLEKQQTDFTGKTAPIPEGDFTHTISKIKKKPTGNSKRDSATWFWKPETTRDTALFEVIAQELFRLICQAHPKTRLVNHEGNATAVISKGIPGFRSLAAFGPDEFKLIHSGKYTGLGHILITALWLNEIDLKLGNMGVDKNGYVIKIDGDYCFTELKGITTVDGKAAKFTITNAVLDNLPFMNLTGDYNAHNWLDAIVVAKLNADSRLATADLVYDPKFRYEINSAILRIILLPIHFIKNFLDGYMEHSPIKGKLFSAITKRQKQLEEAAMNNISFQNFMCGEQSEKEFTLLIASLREFKTMRKHKPFAMSHYILMLQKLKEIRGSINERIFPPTPVAPVATPATTTASASTALESKSPVADDKIIAALKTTTATIEKTEDKKYDEEQAEVQQQIDDHFTDFKPY